MCAHRLNLEVYREFYVLNNESKTRSFVCLPVEDRTGTLSKLVGAVDTVMKNFQRAEYYQVRLLFARELQIEFICQF